MKPYKVAILSYHPMPYHVAFYRAAHEDPRVRTTVLFLDRYGIEGQFDPEFEVEVKWDLPLLEGFESKFLRNVTFDNTWPLFMRVNPGLFGEIALRDYDAVLITGYDTLSAHFALLSAKLSGKKVIMRAEADLTNPSTPLRRGVKKLFLGRIFSLCDALLYSCERNRRYFEHFGVAEEKLFPILSSVDNARLRKIKAESPRRRAEMRKSLGIPENAVVFLFCGRHIERKRPHDLLRAFSDVSRSSPSAWLLSIGDGPLRKDLEEEAKRNALHRVIYAGFKNLSEIPDYYLMADVFVQPSSYDPTPKAVNEAQVFALPAIVSTGVGTAYDLVCDGENGLVFETGDIAALAGAMRRLAREGELRRRMGRKAESVIDQWSPQANVDGLVAALEHCFAKGLHEAP